MTGPAGDGWLRLSPRMLLVHPVHEVLRQLPVLIGSLVLGSTTGNPFWTLAGVGLVVGYGIARWFTTSYRIDADEVRLRTGVLRRSVLTLPRSRIRSVSTDARLLHRLLGLAVLEVGTGQQAGGDTVFALDAVPAQDVSRLRALLLADSLAPLAGGPATGPPGQVLARWHPSWLRYSPLSVTGLAMIAAAFGVVAQTGVLAALRDSRVARFGEGAALVLGAIGTAVTAGLVVLIAAVVVSVTRSLLTYANLELRRDGDVLHLSHGLLRVREHTFDMRRLRGGTVREPVLVRLFGGARLDAVMTGVGGGGEASQLLPPCPRATAEAVLARLIDQSDAVSGPLTAHGPAATRRRWSRAMALPAVLAAALSVTALTSGVPSWVWPVLAVVTVGGGLLATDRSRSLGHRVGDGWLVTRAGSVTRHRHCVAAAGIVAWTVRQTVMQRRAGVATLVAATAAGVKRYELLDVPADTAWSIAATASPWLTSSDWARAAG
ncbi:Bacterial membrane flanked domain protein [Mycolicibacterium chlorophenolicum]|uniref:Bacterial membrane flanked domain protein n=2 Tax=Mycolicibacterium chlorophenolicum TaxID=37916 RepID=A0A0J6W088_9MYCO|nr:Bacterial membrane flanked domain protein [Mycolicibacterium chlorophenolicum]